MTPGGLHRTFLRALDRLRESDALEFRGGRHAARVATFLVPSDQAFQRLGVMQLQRLLANTTLLARVRGTLRAASLILQPPAAS